MHKPWQIEGFFLFKKNIISLNLWIDYRNCMQSIDYDTNIKEKKERKKQKKTKKYCLKNLMTQG